MTRERPFAVVPVGEALPPTPFDVCTRARAEMRRVEHPRVRVWSEQGLPVTGRLVAVSPVNAWVKVDTTKVPTDWIKRVEYLDV